MTYIPLNFGVVSTDNSSTLALAIAGTYTGTYEQSFNYSNVAITVVIGALESITLSIDNSLDAAGTNETTKTVVISGADTNPIQTFPITSEYFRIRIDADQGTAATGEVQTLFNKTGSKPQTVLVGDTTLENNTNAIVTKSVLNGPNLSGDGVFRNVSVAPILGGINSMASAITSPVDAFGRLQVSNPFDLFSAKQQTNNAPLDWDTDLTGTATASYTLGFPQTTMQVLASGDRSVRQQHGYSIYQPGKSFLVLATGTLLEDTSVTNVTARIGLFDDLNDKTVDDNPTGDGFFFQIVGGGTPVVSVVHRTSNDATIPPTTPPTQTDTTVDQSSWNIDPLDGTGISGITIDFEKRQIFVTSMEWLGVGNVVMGVFYNMMLVPCHNFKFSGGQEGLTKTIAYDCRGSLPVRYELEATGVPSATATMRQVCSAVSSEGGFQPFGPIYSTHRDVGEVIGGTPEPIVSLRLNQTGTSDIRPRVKLNILNVNMVCTTSANMAYRLYKFHNPFQFGAGPLSGGGGPVWINASGDPGLLYSAAEYDITSNILDITGVTYPFTLVEQGFFSNNSDAISAAIKDRIILASDIAGNSDLLVVVMESLAGNETNYASIQWQEFE